MIVTEHSLELKTAWIISDLYSIRIRKIKYGYPIIRVNIDTDMVLHLNYMYYNSAYIPYILIYIVKKILFTTIIR